MKPTESELRELYITQGLSTAAIADQLGWSAEAINKWMRQYNIPRRPRGRGLLNRGVKPPSPEELERMVHVEHLSYRKIASRYDVNFSAVQHWLDKHGIRRPTLWETRHGRSCPLRFEEVKVMREADLATWMIGEKLGVSEDTVRRFCKKHGLPIRPGGFKNGIRYTCADGTEVRSLYEKRVADWLIAKGIPFIYEPPLPFNDRPRASRMRGDFLANGWYVEVWGVDRSKSYDEKRDRKRSLYQAHGLPLLELNFSLFSPGRSRSLEEQLRLILSTPQPQHLPESSQLSPGVQLLP